MSSDFYFKKWKEILVSLQTLVNNDLEYQTDKTHDQHLEDAVYRVSSILSKYIALYNEAVECVHNNLQVQKTEYMKAIVKSMISRIFELKQHLELIEGNRFHFFGDNLISNHLTPDDIEMTTLLSKPKRSPHIQDAINSAFQKVKELRETPEPIETEEEEKPKIFFNPFLMESLEDVTMDDDKSQAKENDLPEEERVRRDFLIKIQAQEKLRQTTRSIARSKRHREVWLKELNGTVTPQARFELRVKSAKLIQRVLRAYFEIKRKKLRDFHLDCALGIDYYCNHVEMQTPIFKELPNKEELHNNYEKQRISEQEKFKGKFLQMYGDVVTEDCRDYIRNWFREWFDTIQVIPEIPENGPVAVIRDEVNTPHEWLKTCKKKAENKILAKGKVSQELQYDKQQAKQLIESEKRSGHKQRKVEAAILQKMMANPKMHPGYSFLQSKIIHQITKAIHDYHGVWDEYDIQDIPEAKSKYIKELNLDNVYNDAKIELVNAVTEEMRLEQRKLKTALKHDYKNSKKNMPEIKSKPKLKQSIKIKAVPSVRIADIFETLLLQGFIVEYPDTKIDDFIGDPNFAGEDLRRSTLPAFPLSHEIRLYWWKICHDVSFGSQNVLLVGPSGSGKITLIHALASINDAVLFQLDPTNFPPELLTSANLSLLLKNIVFCAKAVQPSVIHVKHIQKLFYTKVPPEERNTKFNLELISTFLKKLIKKIQKLDTITIIGTCAEPWLAKSKELVKRFPTVVLMPNCSYSLRVQLLKDWVGKIAANGLSPMELYNYFLDNEPRLKTDYEKYLKWYWEKTPVGKKEKRHFKSQQEFKSAAAEIKTKEAMKEQMARRSAQSSKATSHTTL